MSYQPREFWEQRLAGQFDLRGTGQTAMSEAYNRACYALRREVLDRALREAAFDPRGRSVLDVGCGVGFFTAYYLERGARVTGIDIAPTSIERLRARHPEARFILGDVSEVALEQRFDLVNAFDVLYHVVDEARWDQALRHLAAAVAPGGLLLVTDTFSALPGLAAHNRMRPLERYRAILEPAGLTLGGRYPTHVLLNRDLGLLRFVNRAPGVLLTFDRALLALGAGRGPHHNKLLVARRGAPAAGG
jgi:SAM-dependent methyltransferase